MHADRALATSPSTGRPGRTGTATHVAGVLGRAWLWFVGGCLVVTLAPLLLGWRPYVVQSGSMLPRIHVGDVVIAAPVTRAADLVGRVAVFVDPSRPDTLKTHRVLALDPGGTLTTKGDANPTPDTARVPLSDVRGLGRLVVEWVGLPMVWTRTGRWLPLLAFLASLLAAAVAVSRDTDDHDAPDASDDGRDDDPGAGPRTDDAGGALWWAGVVRTVSRRVGARRSAERRRSPWPLARPALGVACAGVLAVTLALPGAGASFTASTASAADSWTVGSWGYAEAVLALSPWLYWRLDETGTTPVAADSSGHGRTGVYSPGVTSFVRGVVGALTSSVPNDAVTLNGTTACLTTSSTTAVPAPTQLTEVVWFRTTSTAGGKLLGFESPQTGSQAASAGGAYDRQLYLDASGRVWFGIGTSSPVAISSQAGLDDGAWHMAAATLGSSGMALYVDGRRVATSTSTAAGSYDGWWRAGCGNLSGWGRFWDGGSSPGASRNQVRNIPFAGSLDEVAVWQQALTAAQVSALYAAR